MSGLYMGKEERDVEITERLLGQRIAWQIMGSDVNEALASAPMEAN